MSEENRFIVSRKIKVHIINNMKKRSQLKDHEISEVKNKQYEFLRDAMYNQNLALNIAMSRKVTKLYECKRDFKSDEFVEFNKSYKINLSNEDFKDINFGVGIDTTSLINQIIKADFKKAIENGLLKGTARAPFYKLDYPLQVRGRNLKFEDDENSDNVICTTSFGGGITFNCDLGHKKNGIELKHTLRKVINEEYKICGSSIQRDGNKWFINLSIEIPKTKVKFVEGRTLGVDLGLAVPVFAVVSDSLYIRKSFGSYDKFAKNRLQFKARRDRLNKDLAFVNGGKGRKRKLSNKESLRDKESKFAKTYNHTLSRKIVDFAVYNQCEYINLEALDKKGMNNKILGIWSYYELQTMIEYKADSVGVKVRYIDPVYTSQTCSKCGYIDKENRETQKKFVCKKCDNELNADYNAAINISRADIKK